MTLPRLSYHAHLRRVKRIDRAGATLYGYALFNEWVCDDEGDDINEILDRANRLEKLARRQYNDSRAKRGN